MIPSPLPRHGATALLLGGCCALALTPPGHTQTVVPIEVGELLGGKLFSSGLSLTDDRLLVGSYMEATVFLRTGVSFQVEDRIPGPTGSTYEFGSHVALRNDIAVIGDPFATTAAGNTGEVYVYERTGSQWNLTASLASLTSLAAHDQMGTAVAMGPALIVVGANRASLFGVDRGAVFVYRRISGGWRLSYAIGPPKGTLFGIGGDVAVSNTTVLSGNPKDFGGKGSAHAIELLAGGQTREQVLKPSSALGSQDYYGYRVAVDGDTAVVTAPYHTAAAPDSGAAWVFRRVGGIWSVQRELSASDGGQSEYFGQSLVLRGDRMVIGASDSSSSGLLIFYVFDRIAGIWTETAKVPVGDPSKAFFLANTVQLEGTLMATAGPRFVGGSVTLFQLYDEIGSAYCGPAVPNSSGLPAEIAAGGRTAVADNELGLLATHLPVGQFGYFLASETQGFVANPGGSQGNLCLGGTIGRFMTKIRNSGASGSFDIPVDLTNMPPPAQSSVLVGETWNFQAWFRDKNPNQTSNFTDAVSVTFH